MLMYLFQAEWVQPALSGVETIPALSYSSCLSLDLFKSVPAFLT